MKVSLVLLSLAFAAAITSGAPAVDLAEAAGATSDINARGLSDILSGVSINGLGNQWKFTTIGATLRNGLTASAPQCFMLNACYGILLTDPLYDFLVTGYTPCKLTTMNAAPLIRGDPAFTDILQLAAVSQPIANSNGKRLPSLTPATRYCYKLFINFFGYADPVPATGNSIVDDFTAARPRFF